ncbi:MAG: CsgG/HfaB family protein [Mastigocoleus sp.]
MNCYFVRCATLSIFASLFTLIIETRYIYSVNAQELKADSNNTKKNCSISSRFATKKLRIAVTDFTISATSLNGRLISNNVEEVKRIADIVASKLAKDNNFIVVDRTQIKPNFDLCQIRQKLGIEAVLIGTLTQYDISNSTSKGGFLGFGKTIINRNADVELAIRIINTATGEIVSFFPENGKSTSRDNSLRSPKLALELSNNKNYTNTVNSSNEYLNDISDQRGTNFKLTINSNQQQEFFSSSMTNEGKLMTLATKEAINKLVSTLNANRDHFVSVLRSLNSNYSLVVGTFGNFIVLNHGKIHGYREGMNLVIEEKTKVFRDPQTGEVVRTLKLPLGRVKIIDVDDKSSLARVIPSRTSQIIFSEEIRKQIEQGNITAKPLK